MASLVCVITRRINRDNTVWDTNIVTPAKKNITQEKKIEEEEHRKQKQKNVMVGSSWIVCYCFLIGKCMLERGSYQ